MEDNQIEQPQTEQPVTAQVQPVVQKAPKAKRDQTWATGRRKLATARVRLINPGTGRIVVNGRLLEKYFTRETHRLVIVQPLKLVKMNDKVDIYANVAGGGPTGQAEAIRHGISRVLQVADTSLRTVLKKGGFLTRDPRTKERKKYGRKRARKRFQFSKR